MTGPRTRIPFLPFIVLSIALTQTDAFAADGPYGLIPGPPGTPSGSPLALPSGSGVTTFTLNDRTGLEVGTPAGDAFDLALGYVAGWLQDPVDVVLNVNFANLGSGRLAEADNNHYSDAFSLVRAAMITDQQAHVGPDITDDLPAFSEFNAALPTAGSSWGLTGSMEMTRANAKALGFSLAPGVDSTISFNSSTVFDFDPSDGISTGAYDFVGIAVHEIGHTLGFDSEVDKADFFIDLGSSGIALSPSPMDMFRLLPGQGVIDFKSAMRVLTTGDDPSGFYGTQVSYQGLGIEAELSTAGASGQGASHWADALGLGIMDPTFAPGEAGVPTFTDWRVFDLIGWDAVQPAISTPVPAAVWLFGSGLALLGFTGKRCRRS